MKQIFLIALLLFTWVQLFSQEERKYIRQGVRAYNDNKYDKAEVDFRKAEELVPDSPVARFNTGTALYGQEKYKESFEQFTDLAQQETDPKNAAAIWHNAGNALLQKKEYAKSIEAYKNSLRLNPADQDTRYNLAYAQKKLLEQQQQQQQQQDKQDQNKNKEDQQNNKQNQDQQDDKQDDQKDQSSKQDQQEQKQDKQQQQQQAIPREEAERLLNALLSQEKEVKEKVDKAKAQAAKIKTEKDW